MFQQNSSDLKVKVQNGILVCCKQGHNKEITMVNMEKDIPMENRLLCQDCFKHEPTISKYSSIEQVSKQMQDYKEQVANSKQQQYKGYLLEFENALSDFKSKVLQHLDQMQEGIKHWNREIDQLNIEHQENNFLGDLKSFISKEENKTQKLFMLINKSHYHKIQQSLKKLMAPDCFQRCFEKFRDFTDKITNGRIKNKSKIKISEIKIQNIVSDIKIDTKQEEFQLIKSINQKAYCGAIAFNPQGNLIATGCDNQIKVWKVDKRDLVSIKTLNGHENQIYCLIFSKKCNWFISGSSDSTIRCWQENSDLNWVSSKPGNQHKEMIYCIVLNSKEDELISCSFDKQIIVWKTNQQKNSLEFNYVLEQKHTLWVYSICLNSSETAVVSCGGDKMIVLWQRGLTQKWVYKSHILMDDFGFRLSFINDNTFIWLQQGKGVIHILENNKGSLIQNGTKLELNLGCYDGHGLFPIIFDKKRDILIVKHNRFVYRIKFENEKCKLNILGKPIDCGDQQNFGALNNQGEDLVIWSNGTKEFKRFQLTLK